MQPQIKEQCFAFVSIVLFLALVFGFVFLVGRAGNIGGRESATEQMQSEAIKHGAAYYHPETGEFTWKGEATE